MEFKYITYKIKKCGLEMHRAYLLNGNGVRIAKTEAFSEEGAITQVYKLYHNLNK